MPAVPQSAVVLINQEGSMEEPKIKLSPTQKDMILNALCGYVANGGVSDVGELAAQLIRAAKAINAA